MQSINEIAKELGVSRQRIQQIVASLPKSKRPKKVSGRYLLNESEKQMIASQLTNKVAANPAESDTVSVLRQQIADKDKEIEFLREQHVELTKLVDQAQRLQASAENKVQQLTTNMPQDSNTGAVSNSSENLNNLHENTKKEPKRAPKGFFSRLFKN